MVLGGLLLAGAVPILRVATISTAAAVALGALLVASVVLGQLWSAVYLHRRPVLSEGTVFAGRGTMGMERGSEMGTGTVRARQAGPLGFVRLWGDLVMTAEGLTFSPNRASLGAAPVVLRWDRVHHGEIAQCGTRAAMRLTLSDRSDVWIETGASRVSDLRQALVAAGVPAVPGTSAISLEESSPKSLVAMPLVALGVVVALLGAISAVHNVVAARDGHAFTVALGGLLIGLAMGLVLLGVLASRRDRLGVPSSAAVVVSATFIGYLVGGSMDAIWR